MSVAHAANPSVVASPAPPAVDHAVTSALRAVAAANADPASAASSAADHYVGRARAVARCRVQPVLGASGAHSVASQHTQSRISPYLSRAKKTKRPLDTSRASGWRIPHSQ